MDRVVLDRPDADLLVMRTAYHLLVIDHVDRAKGIIEMRMNGGRRLIPQGTNPFLSDGRKLLIGWFAGRIGAGVTGNTELP